MNARPFLTPQRVQLLGVAADFSVENVRLELVGIPFKFRRVHRFDASRERGEAARRLGAQPIRNGRPPLRNPRREEADAVVSILDVSAEIVAVITARRFDRLEPGGLAIFEENRLVLVFRFENQLNFDKIAGSNEIAGL